MRASSSICGSISSGPNEQFSPTTSGCACAIEMRDASTVWPLRFRPDLSMTVPEIMGKFLSGLFKHVRDGEERGFGVECVEDSFDYQKIDTSFDQGVCLIEVSLFELIECDSAERGIVYIG